MIKSRIAAVVLVLMSLFAGGAALANAESPYKFGPQEVQCQAAPDQPKCVGSH